MTKWTHPGTGEFWEQNGWSGHQGEDHYQDPHWFADYGLLISYCLQKQMKVRWIKLLFYIFYIFLLFYIWKIDIMINKIIAAPERTKGSR